MDEPVPGETVAQSCDEALFEQARADSERLKADPGDEAEMRAIQAFMGVAG
jgi:hypothetical protein